MRILRFSRVFALLLIYCTHWACGVKAPPQPPLPDYVVEQQEREQREKEEKRKRKTDRKDVVPETR